MCCFTAVYSHATPSNANNIRVFMSTPVCKLFAVRHGHLPSFLYLLPAHNHLKFYHYCGKAAGVSRTFISSQKESSC